jgi:hypothetical protein
MGYNKKILSKAVSELGKAKAPAKPKDIITDPKGQWAHPGQVTRIPGNNITMQGVPYPVYGVDNTGFAQMMYPGQDYQFQGDYVDEYPLTQAKKGGEKKYSRSLSATNKLFKKNPLVKAKKKKNKKTFDPNAKYYQDGGENWTEVEASANYRNMFQNMVEVDYETSNSSKSFEYMPNGNVKEVTKYYDVPKIDKLPTKPIKSIDTNISSIDNKPLNNFTFINRYNPKTNSWIQNTVPANSLSDKLNQEREEWKRKNIQQQDGGYIDLDLDDNEILELQKGGYIVEYLDDPSIPELTKAQTGGQKDAWGRLLNDKWYGFDPKTKKYTIAPYKIEELRKRAAGMSKYDALQQKTLPSETTQRVAKQSMQAENLNEVAANADRSSYLRNLQNPGGAYDTYTDKEIVKMAPDDVKQEAQELLKNGTYSSLNEAIRGQLKAREERKVELIKNPLLTEGYNPRQSTALNNYNDAPAQSADWLWTLPMGATAAGRNLLTQGLPQLASTIGKTNLVNNPITRSVIPNLAGSSGLAQAATTYGTVDKLSKIGTLAKTAQYTPQILESSYNIGRDVYDLQYAKDPNQRAYLEDDLTKNVKNIGNIGYNTFLDYGPANKLTSALKFAKYADKSYEEGRGESDYKSIKSLSGLFKKQEGGEGPVDKEQDLQEVTHYGNESKRKLQGDLLDKLQQVKGAYQDWRQDAGLRKASLKSEGASSIEALRAQIDEYKKELEEEKKKYSRAQTALNILKKNRPDEWKNAKLSDVMSSKGIESLRSLYSEGTLTEGAFRDFYNNFGSQYDANVKKGTGPDKDYSAKEAKQEWMENVPEFVEQVSNFTKGAALLPAAAVIAPTIASGVSAAAPYLTAAARSPLGRWASTAASRAFLADTLVNEVPETLRSVDQAIAGEKSWTDAGKDVAWTAADLLFSKGAAKDILKRGKKLFKPVARFLDTPIGETLIRTNPVFNDTPAGRFAQASMQGIKNMSATNALKIAGVSTGLTQLPGVASGTIDLRKQLGNEDLSRREKWDATKNYTGDLIKTASLMSPVTPRVVKSIIDFRPVQYGLLQDNINKIIQGDNVPPGQVIRNYRNITGLTPTSGFRLRQTGGELNSYTATLSKKEIRELEKQGYNIEYLD